MIRINRIQSKDLVYLKQDIAIKDRNYEGGGYGVTYFKNDIHIGNVTNGVLTEILSLQQIEQSYSLCTEFCAKKVKETKEKIQQLKDEVSKLESSIYSFKNIY